MWPLREFYQARVTKAPLIILCNLHPQFWRDLDRYLGAVAGRDLIGSTNERLFAAWASRHGVTRSRTTKLSI